MAQSVNLITINLRLQCYKRGLTILNFEAEKAGDIVRRILLHASPLEAASPPTAYSAGAIGTLCCKDTFMTIILCSTIITAIGTAKAGQIFVEKES
jgi:hypothetical protein